MILTENSYYFLKSINHLISVMVKCCVFFAVRTEFLNIIWTSFGFKGLILYGSVKIRAISTYSSHVEYQLAYCVLLCKILSSHGE
jgi:hypothetical protein